MTPSYNTTQLQKVMLLTVKKVWFDMIACGEKLEEYREIKPYWTRRLCIDNDLSRFKTFDMVVIRNGYGKKAPTITVQCLGITIREPVGIWSAGEPGVGNKKKCFVIQLGEIIKIKNYV